EKKEKNSSDFNSQLLTLALPFLFFSASLLSFPLPHFFLLLLTNSTILLFVPLPLSSPHSSSRLASLSLHPSLPLLLFPSRSLFHSCMKTTVSEAEHPLLCEGTRRE